MKFVHQLAALATSSASHEKDAKKYEKKNFQIKASQVLSFSNLEAMKSSETISETPETSPRRVQQVLVLKKGSNSWHQKIDIDRYIFKFTEVTRVHVHLCSPHFTTFICWTSLTS